MIHNISRFIAALALALATGVCAKAGAQEISNVPYIDANGNSQNVDATVVTTDMEGTTITRFFSTNGWFYVKENVTLNGGAHSLQSVAQNIILGDGATLTVSGGRFIFDQAPSVNIYCQSGGTGKLVVSGPSSGGAIFKILNQGTLTIYGGTVEVTNTSTISSYGFAGNLVMNGGTASFTCTGDFETYAISGSVTLNGGTFTATNGREFPVCKGAMTIGYGKYFKDSSGNGYTGTLTDQLKKDINGKTLTPITQTDYIHTSFGADNDGSADHPYTISNANGWDAFCLALEDNTTWNGFSGKTVKLDANIEVSRMAGSGGHEFMGNFNGGGNTLTFTATAADNYCAPFRNVKGGSDEDHAITISNLNVKTTITANDFRHAAGLIALQWGHVNVTGCNADVTISSTVGTSNPYDLYPAGLVSQASSDNGGTLTVTGCTASGTISTDGKYAAGLVGIVQGTASISDCISSVTINSSTSGDGTHGGIVAALSGVTNIYGTVFNGRLLGEDTESVGGFIGWRSKGANIYNSLFIPTEVTVKKANSATFARNDVDTHNCYYTYYLCDGEHYVPYYATDGITRRNGHAPLAVTAGENVTVEVSPVGSHTSSDGYNGVYSVSGITAYAKGITRTVGDVTTFYYGQGDQVSLTLSNTGAPDGYQYGYTTNAGTLDGSTLTMPDQDVTVSVNTAVLRSTGVAVEVSYVDAGGTARTDLAIALDGTETSLGEGWYFVGTDIAFDHTLYLSGNVHLILADGCTMNITTSEVNGIEVNGSMTIYGQAEGTGTLNATGDEGIHTHSGDLTISGGRVTATGDEGIHTHSGDLTISGGTVTATGGNEGIHSDSGTITISGGRVTATGGEGIHTHSGTITLGCTTASDFIYVSSYFVGFKDRLNIADGQTLYDEDGNFYNGNGVTNPDGKTLRLYGIDLTARRAPDGNYWTTYYNGTTGFTIEGNACAYTATYSAGQLTLHKLGELGKEIPAGTAVIIVADNSMVSMTAATDDLPPYSGPTNDLHGVDYDTDVDDITSALGEGTFYVLGMTTVGDEQHFGFHRYTGSEMAAHKAFVHVGGSQAARSLTMVFDEATGISDATRLNNKEQIKNNNWFTLDGRRLQAKPTAPGIYVNNGKKVVIK